jgi:hypothetical protein
VECGDSPILGQASEDGDGDTGSPGQRGMGRCHKCCSARGTERQVSTAVGKTEGTTSGMRGVGNSGSARTAGDEVTVATISDFENNVATGEAKAVVAVMAMASREVCMFALGSL